MRYPGWTLSIKLAGVVWAECVLVWWCACVGIMVRGVREHSSTTFHPGYTHTHTQLYVHAHREAAMVATVVKRNIYIYIPTHGIQRYNSKIYVDVDFATCRYPLCGENLTRLWLIYGYDLCVLCCCPGAYI